MLDFLFEISSLTFAIPANSALLSAAALIVFDNLSLKPICTPPYNLYKLYTPNIPFLTTQIKQSINSLIIKILTVWINYTRVRLVRSFKQIQ